MKKITFTLLLLFFYKSILISQTITSLSVIATPNSQNGWVYFKNPAIINPVSIFANYKNAFSLNTDDNMQIIKTETDKQGTTHTYYQQYFKGIKVEGCQYIIHSKNSESYLANGKTCTGLSLSIMPNVTASDAINYAKAFVNATKYMWEDSTEEHSLKEIKNDNSATYYPSPELLVTMNGSNLSYLPANFKLAYKIDLFTKKPFDGQSIYIDANTGIVLKKIPIFDKCVPGNSNTLFTGNQPISSTYNFANYSTPVGSWQYTLNNPCKGGGIITRHNNSGVNGDMYNSTNDWSGTTLNRAAGTLHWGTEKFYDFMFSTYGRRGYDDNDHPMLAMVEDIPGSTDNAVWSPSPASFGRFFISGANGQPNTYWVANDIIGHEWGHAVTETASGLILSGEARALNEGFSDIWGTLFEFFAQGGTGDWTFGEDVFVSGTSFPNYYRSLSNPHSCGNPDSYLGLYYSTGCNPILTSGSTPPGCVDGHNLCGIVDYWFYLLSQGGTGTNNSPVVYTYNVSGIGSAQAGQILYRSYKYLISSSDFHDARNATIQAARDLYGECSSQVSTVKEAWNAVGVYGTNSCMTLCVNKTDANCTANIGTANVSITGGVAPYTYQWYNAATNSVISGATSSSINGLAPGAYYVIVNDNASCVATSLNSIILGGSPNLAFTITNANCTGGNADGSATALASGGLAPYTYLWDPSVYLGPTPTLQTINNLTPGSYNVTVTDANGCTVSGTSPAINQNSITFDIPFGTQITGAVTWNQSLIKVDGLVEVVSGGVLTITGNTRVEFSHHADALDPMPYGVARLIVQPGGQLNVDGNVILTGCGGGIWDGLELWGTGIFNTGFSYSNIYGTIENADIGIYTSRRPKKNQSIVNNYGGAFTAVGAKFKNNKVAIKIPRSINNYGYVLGTNQFSFDGTSRYKNDYSIANNTMPIHVYAGENVNLTAKSNLFNGGINDYPSDLRGTGIKCVDCKLTVNKPYSGTYAAFSGLTRGIDATYIFTSNQLNVSGAYFTNTQEGIYMQGSSLGLIKTTNFEVPPPVAPITKSYGIFAVNSNGFDISGNTINPLISDNNSYGMVFENTGITGGVVFNNTFNGVGIGLQAQKDNQNLKVGCNIFNNPTTLSMAVVNVPSFATSLMKDQGTDCSGNGKPAGNEWPYVCNTSTSDVNVFAGTGVSFKYYSYKANALGQSYTKPLCSTSIWEAANVVPWICSSLQDKDGSSCGAVFALPPPPPSTPYSSYYAAIKNLIASNQNQIALLTPKLKTALATQDGGNTQNLLNAINQNPKKSPGQLKNILNSSGSLSDDVLIAAINRNPTVSSGILKDILATQVPLSVNVLTALENIHLPNGIINLIYAAQSNSPLYNKASTIESQIQNLKGDIILLESELQRTKLLETDKISREDSKFFGDVSSKILLTQDYATKNQTDSVRLQLNNLISDTTIVFAEKSNFISYMNTIADIIDNNNTIFTANNTQVTNIQTVAGTNTKAAAHANAALKERKESHYHYFVADIPLANNQRLADHSNDDEENEKIQLANTGSFKLFPNPNSGSFKIQLEMLNKSESSIIINITNLIGQIVFTKTVIAKNDNNIIDIQDEKLYNGIYIVTLINENKVIGQSKLVIE